MRKLFLIFVFLLIGALRCFATDWYFAIGGDDTDDICTQVAPCEDLQKLGDGIGTDVGTNDNVYLNRGDTWTSSSGSVCSETVAAIHISGTSGVTVDAYGTGNDPKIDCSGEADPTPDINYPNYTVIEVWSSSHNVTISNIEVVGAEDTNAIMVRDSDNVTLSNLTVSGYGWQVAGDDNESLLQANNADDFTLHNSSINAIGLSEVYGKAIEIRNNTADATITGNTFRGILVGGTVRFSGGAWGSVIGNFFWDSETRDSPSATVAIVFRSLYNDTVKAINNVIDMTEDTSAPGSSFRAISLQTNTGSNTFKLFNNTMIGQGSNDGICIHNGASETGVNVWNNICVDWNQGVNNAVASTTIYNNIFYNCTSNWDDSPITANNYTSNPNLVDVLMGDGDVNDADIQSSSAAINAGRSSGDSDLPSDDINGDTRDAEIDIGAFEYSNPSESICNDSVDNDSDGNTDCADNDCDGETGPSGETCEYGTELTCDDGYDNDADGTKDCEDETDCLSPVVNVCAPKAPGFSGTITLSQ